MLHINSGLYGGSHLLKTADVGRRSPSCFRQNHHHCTRSDSRLECHNGSRQERVGSSGQRTVGSVGSGCPSAAPLRIHQVAAGFRRLISMKTKASYCPTVVSISTILVCGAFFSRAPGTEYSSHDTTHAGTAEMVHCRLFADCCGGTWLPCCLPGSLHLHGKHRNEVADTHEGPVLGLSMTYVAGEWGSAARPCGKFKDVPAGERTCLIQGKQKSLAAEP